MNKDRRNQIKKVISMLQNAKEILNSICDEEQDAYDNMPENLQGSMRASDMEDAISEMSDALDAIDDVCDTLEGVT